MALLFGCRPSIHFLLDSILFSVACLGTVGSYQLTKRTLTQAQGDQTAQQGTSQPAG